MLSREEQDLQIRIAMARGAAGDPWDMVVHLQRANILSGVKLTFRRRWPDLPDEEIDDIVARSVDALFDKVSAGDAVENPVGYMLEVMRHEAYDYTASHGKAVPFIYGFEPVDHEQDVDIMDDARRDSAIAAARSLVPRLGQESVQAVMSLIFDALEDGRTRVTTTELADATGLSEDTVRQCRSRGFRRLERIAREEGYHANVSTIHDQTDELPGRDRVS